MPDPPLALIAEVTHRCPLRCPYCSNPTDLVRGRHELGTAEWVGVVEQAVELGVVQVHLTGGEPLLRSDLETLADAAARGGAYANLVTSGVGLTRARARSLRAAGVRAVQLSIQADDAALADLIAGTAAHDQKLAAAADARAAGLALTVNVVLHRANIDRLDAMVDLALAMGASRVELANAQYHGWALANRAALLPSPVQLARAEARYEARRQEVEAELVWVVPDYAAGVAKPCMGGWGRLSMTVAPDGTVLPCPAASSIGGLTFERVGDRPLADIWRDSPGLNAFRGTDWMPEPCRSCEHREADFGGCRCQAFALTGDAARTDPACALSPDHALVLDALAGASAHTAPAPRRPRPVVYRAREAVSP